MSSRYIKVKTHKRSLHKDCQRKGCSKDAVVTGQMKTGTLVLSFHYCEECAVLGGIVNGS